jgi:hypothetical protein
MLFAIVLITFGVRYSGHDLDKRIETFAVNESPQCLTVTSRF